MKKITIAHSPDADDIFMYMAVKLGWIGKDFAYENKWKKKCTEGKILFL